MNIRVESAYDMAGAAISGAGHGVSVPQRATTPHGLYRSVGKRLMDLVFVALVAVPATLVTLVLAGLVMLDGKNPFYSQNRVGMNGRAFRMWKLRSMVADADQVLAQYLEENPAAKAEWDRDQKLKNDPRITKFGRLIRATSLDELPQIFNVLTGDMSLVGPRPIMCNQRVLYPGTEYYAMRPGITGYWQISVRNESSFRQRAGYDAAYYADLSLGTDLKVVARTFGVVLKATGH